MLFLSALLFLSVLLLLQSGCSFDRSIKDRSIFDRFSWNKKHLYIIAVKNVSWYIYKIIKVVHLYPFESNSLGLSFISSNVRSPERTCHAVPHCGHFFWTSASPSLIGVSGVLGRQEVLPWPIRLTLNLVQPFAFSLLKTI